MKRKFVCITLLFAVLFCVVSASHDQLLNQLKRALDMEDYRQAKALVRKIDHLIDDYLIASTTVEVSEDFQNLLDSARSPLALSLSDSDELLVYFGSPTIYKLRTSSPSDVELALKTKDGKDIISNKYLSINGETKQIKYKSSNPSIATINDSGRIKILDKGYTTITVSVDNIEGSIPIQVVELPIKSSTTSDDVLLLLGFPDTVNEEYISWPNSATVDGIFYNTTGKVNGVLVKHWLYNKYPGLVLIPGDSHQEIKNPTWFSYNLAK